MCKLLPIARFFCYKSSWLDLYLDMCCFMSQKNLSRCFGIFFFSSFFSHYFSIQHFGLSVHSSDILWKDNSSKGKHFLTCNSSFMLALHSFEECVLLPTAQSFFVKFTHLLLYLCYTVFLNLFILLAFSSIHHCFVHDFQIELLYIFQSSILLKKTSSNFWLFHFVKLTSSHILKFPDLLLDSFYSIFLHLFISAFLFSSTFQIIVHNFQIELMFLLQSLIFLRVNIFCPLILLPSFCQVKIHKV